MIISVHMSTKLIRILPVRLFQEMTVYKCISVPSFFFFLTFNICTLVYFSLFILLQTSWSSHGLYAEVEEEEVCQFLRNHVHFQPFQQSSGTAEVSCHYNRSSV